MCPSSSLDIIYQILDIFWHLYIYMYKCQNIHLYLVSFLLFIQFPPYYWSNPQPAGAQWSAISHLIVWIFASIIHHLLFIIAYLSSLIRHLLSIIYYLSFIIYYLLLSAIWHLIAWKMFNTWIHWYFTLLSNTLLSNTLC